MRARWLSVSLTITMASIVGCGSEVEPQHNAGSIHDAAKKLGPKATELKQLDGTPMSGLPDGLKPLEAQEPTPVAQPEPTPEPEPKPEPTVADLKPLADNPPEEPLPPSLKPFPQ